MTMRAIFAAILVCAITMISPAHAETCKIVHYIYYWYASPVVQSRIVSFRAMQDGNMLDEEIANGEYMEGDEKDEMMDAYLKDQTFVVNKTEIRTASFKTLAMRLTSKGWVPSANDGSWYGWTFERK